MLIQIKRQQLQQQQGRDKEEEEEDDDDDEEEEEEETGNGRFVDLFGRHLFACRPSSTGWTTVNCFHRYGSVCLAPSIRPLSLAGRRNCSAIPAFRHSVFGPCFLFSLILLFFCCCCCCSFVLSLSSSLPTFNTEGGLIIALIL